MHKVLQRFERISALLERKDATLTKEIKDEFKALGNELLQLLPEKPLSLGDVMSNEKQTTKLQLLVDLKFNGDKNALLKSIEEIKDNLVELKEDQADPNEVLAQNRLLNDIRDVLAEAT